MKKRILSVLLSAALLVGGAVMPISAASRKPYITQVEAGAYCLAVTSDGNLYGWGGNEFGVIDPNLVDPGWGWDDVATPKFMMSGVKAVASANEPAIYNQGNLAQPITGKTGHHMLVIKKNGELWAMGDNSCYQAGQGTRYGYEETKDYTQWDTDPVFVMDDVVKADCSGHASAAITKNGDLYFWGYNLAKSTTGGQGIEYTTYTEPTLVLTDVKDVDLGFDHVLALRKDGSVWAMGCLDDGTLGNGVDKSGAGSLQESMVQVMGGCVDIAAGDHTSFFVKSDGILYASGDNTFNKLGVPYDTMDFAVNPIKVTTGVAMVDASSGNACFVKNDGSVWTTGNNHQYQRGIHKFKDNQHCYPSKVTTNVKTVSMSDTYTLLIKNDGQMYGFGKTDYLGTGQKEYPNPYLSYYYEIPYIFDPIPVALSAGAYAGMFGSAFKDVPEGMYYYEPVLWALEEDITSGTSATTFGPNDSCSRGQIITFLWRAAGSPEPYGGGYCTDVPEGMYYTKAVNWAYEESMFDGEQFRPNAPCTRLMAVEFMWKYAGYPEAPMANFTDAFSSAVDWALDVGVTSGTSATTFSPNMNCSRGQIVTFLYNAFA